MRGGGFEVCIARKDDARYEEHQVLINVGELQGSVNASCYLESEEGKTFAIVVQQNGTGEARDWGVDCSVDGRLIDMTVLRPHFKSFTCSHIFFEEDGEGRKGDLTFAALRTTDQQGEAAIDQFSLDEVGTISVEIWRITGEKCKGRRTTAQPSVGVAPENCKKLGGCSDVSNVQQSDLRTDLVVTTDLDEQAYHRFHFKYRIRPVLEMINVVPPSSDPDHNSSSIPSGTARKRKRLAMKSEDLVEGEGLPASRTVEDLERQVEYWKRQAKMAQPGPGPSRKTAAIDLTVIDDEDDK